MRSTLGITIVLAGAALLAGACSRRPGHELGTKAVAVDFGGVIVDVMHVAREYQEAMEESDPDAWKDTCKAMDGVTRRARGSAYDAELSALSKRVHAKARAANITQEATAPAERIARTEGLDAAPSQPPDLVRGEAVFRANCAACHTTGHGTEKGESEPPSFVHGYALDALSPKDVALVVRHGIRGAAANPSCKVALSDEDRWALAFYAFAQRRPACTAGAPAEPPAPKVSLPELATTTDADLERRFGEAALACLRRPGS